MYLFLNYTQYNEYTIYIYITIHTPPLIRDTGSELWVKYSMQRACPLAVATSLGVTGFPWLSLIFSHKEAPFSRNIIKKSVRPIIAPKYK